MRIGLIPVTCLESSPPVEAVNKSYDKILVTTTMRNQKSQAVLVKLVLPRYREPFVNSLVNLQMSIQL